MTLFKRFKIIDARDVCIARVNKYEPTIRANMLYYILIMLFTVLDTVLDMHTYIIDYD